MKRGVQNEISSFVSAVMVDRVNPDRRADNLFGADHE